MTYLSQFPDAELKPGAPIKATSKGDPTKVKVFGPGVEREGLSTDTAVAEFTIDCRKAGQGKATASVESPEGPIECIVEKNKDGTYSCSYVPTVEGEYTVTVLFNGEHAANSPYQVLVAPGSNVGACVAYGPGIEGTDLRASSPTEFWVETAGAGQGKLGITVRGPKGPIGTEDLGVQKDSDDKYHVEYTPQQAGQYKVEVTFAGLHIQNSPFRVRVGADRADASKCKAEGPGIEGIDVEIKKETWFKVYTKGAGRGDLSVHIKGPHGTLESQGKEVERKVHHFTYTPQNSGEHVITIKYGGDHIPGSRFKVQVEPPTDPSKVKAFGPGLKPQGVRVNEPAKFTVRTKDAGHGDVAVKITGPDGEVPSQVETSPYNYNYTYQASQPGDYTVDVTFAGQHVPGSPFPVAITDASKVKITGPGMDGECLPVNQPLVYQVDARGAGPGEIKCTVQDRGTLQQTAEDFTDAVNPLVTAHGDNTFTIEYTPTTPGLQKMNVTFGEAPIPETPVRLNIFDPSKVKAYGPGLEDGNKSGVLTHFTVDMRKAGEGQLHIGMGGPVNTPVTIKDQENNVVKCEYTPVEPGEYVIDIQYEGVSISESPFHVNVRPTTDASAVRAYGPGLEDGLTTDMWAEFFVDYSKAGEGEPQVAVHGPGGGENVEEEQVEEGLRKYRYYIDPDEAGDYKIEVNFADEPIPDSPFNVHVNWKTDPSRVKAYGRGLEGGICGDWTEFTLDMKTAGEGALNLQIEGPCEAQVDVEDHDNGTATVKYLPVEPGEYKINIQFAEQAIPGSPFTPVFEPETDATKVKAYGPGLEQDGVKVGDAGDFIIDTREAGSGTVDVAVDGPYWHGRALTPISPSPSPTHRSTRSPVGGVGRQRAGSIRAAAKPQITSNNDDTYNAVYNPRKVGTYNVHVYFADASMPASPFKVNVTDPTKVKITGPGAKKTGEAEEEAPVISFVDPLEWGVDCTEAGPGNLEATIYTPDGEAKAVEIKPTAEDVYQVTYSPEKAGSYQLDVTYSGNKVKDSPLKFSLADASKVKITGAGLDGGKVNDSLVVEVDTTEAGNGGLSLSLTGPSQCEIDCDDHGDGTATLTFAPNTAGEYKLDVKFAGDDVPGSVFSIPVIDPTKVTVSGSGVTGEGARTGQPAQVIVDTSNSGPAPVEAQITDPDGKALPVELVPTDKEGVFAGEYTPVEPGYYCLEAKFADEEIAGSPFQVPICNPDAVQLTGPGLECAIKEVNNVIDVFTENAGPGEVGVEIQPLEEGALPVESFVTQVDDNHYQVNYTPHSADEIEVQVTFGGFPVGDKKTVPVCDPSKVKVEGAGIESGILAGQETEFVVDATEAGPGDLSTEIQTPDGEKLDTVVAEIEPNKWLVKYKPDKAGNYVVNVQYSGQEVESSPFFVEVCDPEAVRAFGPGLEKATAQEEAEFTVDATKAGEGALGLEITGPADCEINCKESSQGLFNVTYIAPRPGIYHVHLKFADKEIPGSPFEVLCERPPPDASKCIVSGLENPGSFTVDCKDAGGSGLLEVGASGAYVPVEFVSVKHNGDYTFSVSYDIPEPGETIISVKWHGQHLAGSPFSVITK